MGKSEKNINDILEKLVLITDATQELFPNGKSFVVFELEGEDFKEMQKNFRKIDSERNRFKIEISGNEVVFINSDIYSIQDEPLIEKEIVVEKKQKNLLKRLLGFFKSSETSI